MLGRVVQEQQRRIEQLEEQLRLNSGDSSKPPSSDDAKARAARRKKPRSGRKRGAQPGHPDGPPRGQSRVVVDEVDHTERYYPSGCPCGGTIELDRAADRAEPTLRHQVFDLPEVRYTVTEYQQYGGRCRHCGERHLAELPDWIPRGQMGPGLISEIGLLNGQYRMSLRQVQTHLRCRWGLDFSLGVISESQGKLAAWLAPLYAQLGAAVRRTPVAHADETTHYHCGWRLAAMAVDAV
jgi:transposase